ncbi:MAG: TldD/PmbA family protein [Ignisphaera sp.]|nr:TldD/PmbA family protein [Ignisphaera sp.]MCX8167670.1 TldD/PmbA family protein [Ignisphaera sp.]MDW8085660.1 TldD/PmbA family protein [Ignisphaera sp.]
MSIDIYFGRKIVDSVLEKGVEDTIVRLQERVYELIIFDNGVLRSYNISRSSGVGVRVFINGSTGYGYTSSLDWDSISTAARRAVKSAKSLSRHGVSKKMLSYEGSKCVYSAPIKLNPMDVDSERKVSLIKELNLASIKKEGIVSAVTRYGYEMDRKIIVTSYGSEVDIDVRAVGISHTAIAKSGDIMERVHEQKTFIGGFEHIDSFDWFKFTEEIDGLALKASQAKTPPPGIYTAVIDNTLIGLLLHEAFGHAAEGDIVASGASVLRGKIDESIASTKVTIVDDGLAEGGYPVPYDEEGVEKNKTVVVNEGVLKRFLNSRYTAIELNQDLTGNARAQDTNFDTIVRQTNLYMLPGESRVDELFEGISIGFYLLGKGAMGGQVDPSVGTFTFSVGPSYIVRNGEPSELVRGTVVSGNILETLREVDLVAKDLKITTSVFGGCGKGGQMVRVGTGGPHIRVKRIVVGGI